MAACTLICRVVDATRAIVSVRPAEMDTRDASGRSCPLCYDRVHALEFIIYRMQADGSVVRRSRDERIAELYNEASRLPSEQRRAFLERACCGDDAIRADLERMLDTISPPPADPRFPPGHEIAGRFRIKRFLGRGGMGDVYEVEDLELRSRVALKTVRAELVRDPQTLAREILLSKQITHPNVCRVYDLGIDRPLNAEPLLFLTMEFLDGETLSSRILRGPIAPAAALPLIEDMAGALSAAHQTGIVHRDFKSGNVMLVDSSSHSHAVVTDFGLARSVTGSDVTVTDSRVIAGTPAYMAPEQVRGEPVTQAVDIYALGIVIYEMLTGRCPFTDENAMAVALKQVNEQAAPPRTLAPHLDPQWDDVVLRCLRKAPGERFPSAQAVAAAVAAISMEPLAQAPVRRGTLRRPVWWLLAPALLIAAAVGGWLLRTSQSGGSMEPASQPLAPTAPAIQKPLPYTTTTGAGEGPKAPAATGLPTKSAPAKSAQVELTLSPPRPSVREYAGPLRGTIQWSGRLAPHQNLTIQAGHVAAGSLQGDLPRVPVTVEPLTERISVVEFPSQRNRWDRVVLINDSDNEAVEGVVVRWSVAKSTGGGPSRSEAKLPPPRAPLRTDEYGGALHGTIQWSGRLASHQSLTIQASHVLAGSLQGDLPRVPVTVESQTQRISVAEAPSERNHWDRLVLRNDSENEVVEGIMIRWSVIR